MEDRYLYKAKRISDGEWVIGHYVNCCYQNEKDKTGHFILKYPNKYYEIYTQTICQCTGLKDKNGKLIYENDIVSHKYKKYTEKAIFGCIEKRKNYVIKWDNTMVYCGFRYHNSRNIFQFKNGTVSNGDDEVIGNIFDNPELLESEE